VGGKSFNIQKKMQSDEVYDVLRANYILATKLKIRGTPTFIIGTEIIRGYKDTETLQNIINKRKQVL
jgi:protein-disulfide isomerase